MTYDVKIGAVRYALVHDPAHVHPQVLHQHLGTDTTTRDPELVIRRLLTAVEQTNWFDDTGAYIGRNGFGIGIAERE